MDIQITPEMILAQLEYTVNDSSMTQVLNAIENTKGFEKFAKHLISLNDTLKHMNAYVSLSNNTKLFKIKSENKNHVESNMEVFDFEIKEKDMKKMDSLDENFTMLPGWSKG